MIQHIITVTDQSKLCEVENLHKYHPPAGSDILVNFDPIFFNTQKLGQVSTKKKHN